MRLGWEATLMACGAGHAKVLMENHAFCAAFVLIVAQE
jgi:hypothetical protein